MQEATVSGHAILWFYLLPNQEQKVRSLLIVDVRDVAKAHVEAASGKAEGNGTNTVWGVVFRVIQSPRLTWNPRI